MGIVFEILRRSGKTPDEKDRLKRRARGLAKSFFRRSSKSFGILLGPQAFPTSNDDIINSISFSSQGWIAIELGIGSGK